VDQNRHRRETAWIPIARVRRLHPRSYGTYPRILGRYVREQRVISLEDAVRKMSGARRDAPVDPRPWGARQGFHADVVVFDPATIIDRATFEETASAINGSAIRVRDGVAVVSNGRIPRQARTARARPGYCVARCTRTEGRPPHRA